MNKKRFSIFIIILLIGIDQLTKNIALNNLKDSDDFVLIKNALSFTYLENKGAAFSILQNKLWIFYIISIIIIYFVVMVLQRMPNDKKYNPLYWTLCVFLAGVVGNFIDRFSRHYVIDFIYFSIINFPVFNVADIFVTCSIFLLIILIIFVYKEESDFDFIKKK